MKINVEFLGLPDLTKAIGTKRIELELSNGTFGEVLNSLITRFDHPVKKALLDSKGKLDTTIQILLNGQEWLAPDRIDKQLNDRDTLIFMMLVAGG